MNKVEKSIIKLLKDDVDELEYFNRLRTQKKQYEKAYFILMNHWDNFYEEDKEQLDKELKKVNL